MRAHWPYQGTNPALSGHSSSLSLHHTVPASLRYLSSFVLHSNPGTQFSVHRTIPTSPWLLLDQHKYGPLQGYADYPGLGSVVWESQHELESWSCTSLGSFCSIGEPMQTDLSCTEISASFLATYFTLVSYLAYPLPWRKGDIFPRKVS
jgi:hypothetical protein